MIHPFIENKLPELNKIFKNHKVKKAFLFGSACTDRFNANSDVDFLIEPGDEPDPLVKGQILWDLYDALQDLMGRKVDMVMRGDLKNKYFIEEVNRTSEIIYG
jgi:hypothetical protein